MAWIESHEDMGSHWKTQRFSELAKMTIPEAVGIIHLLWHFTLKNAWVDGDLSRYSSEFIAHAIYWKGKPTDLIKTLKKCKLLDGMKVHDWHIFCGDLIKKRIEYKNRKKVRSENLGENSEKSQRISENSQHTVPNLTKPNLTVLGLFKETQEKTIKKHLAERLGYGIDSEALGLAYKDLIEKIQKDKSIKDPMAVALHRAKHGFNGK